MGPGSGPGGHREKQPPVETPSAGLGARPLLLGLLLCGRRLGLRLLGMTTGGSHPGPQSLGVGPPVVGQVLCPFPLPGAGGRPAPPWPPTKAGCGVAQAEPLCSRGWGLRSSRRPEGRGAFCASALGGPGSPPPMLPRPAPDSPALLPCTVQTTGLRAGGMGESRGTPSPLGQAPRGSLGPAARGCPPRTPPPARP